MLLAPGVVPLLIGLAIVSRRSFVATPQSAFLSGASACLLFYACVTRPLWGSRKWRALRLPATN